MTERKYYHYCYVIHNNNNGMKYFGVRTSEKHPDVDNYWGSGSKITKAIKEEGKENFRREVLSIHDTREDAMEYEEVYMADNDCVDSPEYYNLSARSTGGRFDYHEDLKDGKTSSPQEKNGPQTEASVMKSKMERGLKTIAEKEAKEAEKAARKVESNPVFDEDPTDFAIGEQPMSKAEIDRHYADNMDGSPDGRINHKGQMGGKRPGAGRPKGSKSIYSKKSVEKLQDLGIDPLEELVKTYVQVCQDIEDTRSISARTSLYNTRQKIMSDLMKYGYRPIPTKEEKSIEIEDKGPMSIILTDMDDDKPETKH